MKIKYFFIVLLLSSCTNNKFYGYVYDYDTDRPVKDVSVKVNDIVTKTDSNGYFIATIKTKIDSVTLSLKKEEYTIKKVIRKPDSLGMFSKKNLIKSKIYLFKKESDFSSKM